jgi:probable HAF family extracellular repeat protein
MKMRGNVVASLIAAVVLVAVSSVNALEYQITIIEPNGIAYPYCINDKGQVVGTYGYDSFFWEDGQFTVIYALKSDIVTSIPDQIIARAINNSGVIAGELFYNVNVKGFVLHNGDLAFLPSIEGSLLSSAHGINDAGFIVGRAQKWESGHSTNRGCLWEPVTLNPHNITEVPGISWGRARGVNDHNEVVGDFSTSSHNRHAFIYDDVNGMRDIGVLPGQVRSYGYAINNQSQVVGYSAGSPDGYHAFLHNDSNGVMTDLGTLDGAVDSAAFDISDAGLIAGLSIWADDSERGCLWMDGQITDFNDLLCADSNWTICRATSVSDNGQIVGVGELDGQEYAVLLTPVGHLDYDNDVDLEDFAIFSSLWGRSDCNDLNNWCQNADINRNGQVDWADLGKLTEHWLEGAQ